MTKQARRQRKKSCSSLETGMTDHSQGSVKRHDGKQKTVSTEEQKSAIRPTPSDENSSCQTQGLSSGNRIRDWFSGLSWEDRSSVMSIQDGAFLATLVDLATPLSEPHAATGLASSSRGRDGMKVDWNACFPLDNIEQVYNSNMLVRLVEETSTLGEAEICSTYIETKGGDVGSTGPVTSKPKREESEDKRNEEDVKGNGAAAEDTGAKQQSIESDAFRIQNEAGDARLAKTASVEGGSRDFVQNVEYPLTDNVRIVFPSVYNTFLSHPAFADIRDEDSALWKAAEDPITTFGHGFFGGTTGEEALDKFDAIVNKSTPDHVFLSDECYQHWRRSNDANITTASISLLRHYVDKATVNVSEAGPNKQSNTSLAVLLVVAVEVSIITTYDNVHGACTDVEGSPDQDAVKRNLTMRSKASFLRHLIAKEKEDSSLVLIPLGCLLRSMDDEPNTTAGVNLANLNASLQVSFKALVDNLQPSFDGAVDSKPTALQANPPSQEGTSHSHEVPMVEANTPQTTAKRRKKKKFKKKRKPSNADKSVDSCDVTKDVQTTVCDEKPDLSGKAPENSRCTQMSADVPRAEVSSFPEEATIASSQMSVSTAGAGNSTAPKNGERKSSNSESGEKTPGDDKQAKEGISLTAVGGAGTVGVVVTKPEIFATSHDVSSRDTTVREKPGEFATEDNSAWEMVGGKSRGNKNKKSVSGQGRGGNSLQASSGANGTGGSGVKKNKKHSREYRRRNQNPNRKVVKNILASLLEDVDTEVKRRRSLAATKSVAIEPKAISLGRKLPSPLSNGPPQGNAWQAKPMTMRDVVLGRLRAEAEKPRHESAPPTKAIPGCNKPGPSNVAVNSRVGQDGKKEAASAWADQSTAPTVPETLSGLSAHTQSSANTEADIESEHDNMATEKVGEPQSDAGDCSSGDAAVLASPRQEPTSDKNEILQEHQKETSPAPPLPSLLGSGNNNSATSSVASSLEVPHGRILHHHHHNHSSAVNDDDVGYHLLEVCDRLSRDMDAFMGRRALALVVRRRERGALLAALQDTTTKLWPVYHVEMYGSCATQLDLPSSDLDAVICGVGTDGAMSSSVSHQNKNNKTSTLHRSNSKGDVPVDRTPVTQKSLVDPPLSAPLSPYLQAAPLSPNAERVIRLAAELERQPWAVQVKAIPTATVPVVKILADPSRLPGAVASAVSGGDWMMQQHHIAAQAAAGPGSSHPLPPPSNQSHPQGMFEMGHGAHYVPHSPPPWRGADVMNGLFSVDITFEGPEHGGIGSTAFSARVVQDACNESGLPPDRTPVVQTVMVLKELLAQRRLNEPFSGGLSSYALLLLAVAVLKERQIIRRELERVERQRQIVASGDLNVPVRDKEASPRNISKRQGDTIAQGPAQPTTLAKSSGPVKKWKRHEVQPNKRNETASQVDSNGKKAAPRPVTTGVSSWATIAKKNAGATSKASTPVISDKVSQDVGSKPQSTSRAKLSPFADAVSNHTRAGRRDVAGLVIQHQPTTATTPPAPPQSPRQGPVPQDNCQESPTEASSVCDSKDSSEPSFGAPSLFPHGSNDILEVLCSGETTAGKLLLHFLLFYGRHFDSHSTAVDVLGKHHSDFHLVENRALQHRYLSAYVPRTAGGSIDPVTGMLTVDPIVVYDPLEGAEDNNVARSCFAWSSIRWVFAQSYMTLSSAVERSGTPSVHADAESGNREANGPTNNIEGRSASGEESRHTPVDMVSPLLELLLSF